MKTRFRDSLIACFIFCFFCWVIPEAWASLKVWTSTESIQAADLNSNFSQISTTATAANASITNSRIASNAGISFSKLETPGLLPKAWLTFSTACGPSCNETMDASSAIGTLAHTASTGIWTVTWATPRVDAFYGVFVTSHYNLGNCTVTAQVAANCTVKCVTASTGAAVDTTWSLIMMDNL